MKFSANLGFLWTELPLPEAVRAAAEAGFDAVEFHWPYDIPADELARALSRWHIPALGLNTARGDLGAGEFGLSALPGRIPQARKAIDEALAYADRIGATNIHVLAGSGDTCRDTYLENLDYACGAAARSGQTILIEPLNAADAPGYHLSTLAEAKAVLNALGHPNLRVMFDCYHVAKTEGDPVPLLQRLRPLIGHIQFAGVPDRGPPDSGDLDYISVFRAIDAMGWAAPLGAEYRPPGATEDSLDWMARLAPPRY